MSVLGVILVRIFPHSDTFYAVYVSSKYNQRGIQTVQDILNIRAIKKLSTDCLIEGLRLCLYNNNSVFANENLLQTNGTATGAPNSCSYANDIAVASLDQAIMEKKEKAFPEILYSGPNRDDCLVLWEGTFICLFILYLKLTIIKADTIVCTIRNSYAAKDMLIYVNCLTINSC